MDQKLNVTITASEDALINSLNGATQAVNSSTATWAQRLGDTKTQVENAAASIDNLTAGLQQAGANAALPSEDIDRMNAAAEAAAKSMQGMVEKARELQEGASQYNTTVEGFQAIQAAAESTKAEMSDIKAAMDGMDASLIKLSTSVPETQAAFEQLGVSLDDLKSLSPEEKMVAIGEKINALGDDAEKNAKSNEIYGVSWDKLSQYIQNYRQAVANAQNTGGIITNRQINDVIRYTRQMQNLQAQVQQLPRQVSWLRQGFNDLKTMLEKKIPNPFDLANAFGVILKGIQAVGQMAMHFYQQMQEDTKAEADLLQANADAIGEARKETEKSIAATDGYMAKLLEMQDAEELSNLQKMEAADLIENITAKYGDLGMVMDETTGKISGLDAAMAKKMELDKAKLISSLEAQLRQLEAADEIEQRIVEDESKWYRLLLNKGDAPVKEAQNNSNRIRQQINDLSRQLHDVKNEDKAGDFLKTQEAKHKDAEAAKQKKQKAASAELDAILHQSTLDKYAKMREEADRKATEMAKRMGVAMDDERIQRYKNILEQEIEAQEQAEQEKADAAKKAEEEKAEAARLAEQKKLEAAKQAEQAKADAAKKAEQEKAAAARQAAIDSKLSQFGFSDRTKELIALNPAQRQRAVRQQRRNEEIDASIERKMATGRALNTRERRRRDEFLALQAEKQANSPEALMQKAVNDELVAADAQRSAADVQVAAADKMQQAVDNLTSPEVNPNIPDIPPASGTAIQDYSETLSAILERLDAITKNCYFVR